MAKDCGCGGGGTASVKTSAGGGTRFALELPNGTRVGDYPTRSHAEIANSTVYNNKGKIVQR